jgi:tetratricopeptide (TPR) repeat protein
MTGAFNRYLFAATVALLAVAPVTKGAADPVPRPGSVAGAVIARKTGEEVRFIDVSNWQFVDLKQDLVSGDVLRTNATGQLAILFSDRTQIRMGRNATLVVKQITSSTNADTVLELQSGTIWARAERAGPGVQVQTPAATAAIRGTDWTMTVDGPKTSLNVLDGRVDLSNPQGSVSVNRGEGAVASIGQAPQKVVIIDSDDREQMLFYLPAREAFSRMPASNQPVAQMRREADRIVATPAASRTTEDWVTLAEAQLTLEGRSAVAETLAVLKGRRLDAVQQARVSLIEAILLASDKQYAEAARLFDRAGRKLDARRRGVALYGGYYARSLADPNRVEKLPSGAGGPDAAFLRAYAVGFLQDLRAAMTVLVDAERQYPQDAQLPAYRATLALLLNDREQYQEAVARSLSLDPNEPTALEARALYRMGFAGDNKGAMADLDKVVTLAPGSGSAWNLIGNVQSSRDANREAEAAFLKAIALDPQDPIPHANLAIFYLDTGRIEKAKHEIDRALAVDPAFDLGLVARGRYHLQTGEIDKALEDLLAGTVANPAYSQGQLMLAAAHYEKGDRIATGQALDNADRLDDNDPVIAAVRTAIAIDDYDSVGAIRHAQDYLRRSKARGGEFTSVGANHEAGSTLNDAFRLQGLDAWGEYYGDVAFDPFQATAYVDQSIRGSSDPFVDNYFYGDNVITNQGNGQAFSSLLQGLLLDPHIISGPSREANLLKKPFLEAELGGGFTTAGGRTGYTAEGEVQAYGNLPFPISLYANLQWQKVPDARDIDALTDLDTENRLIGGNAYLTASPTAYDRMVFYVNHSKSEIERSVSATIPDPSPLFLLPPGSLPAATLTTEQDVSTRTTAAGLGWSHTVAYQNVVNAALLYTGINSHDEQYLETDFSGLVVPIGRTVQEFDQKAYIAAINHMVGVDNLTWRYGAEGGVIRLRSTETITDLRPPAFNLGNSSSRAYDDSTVGRVYVDLLHEISDSLKAEYALFGSYIDGDISSVARIEPRIGLAWQPVDGQWLRAGFMRSSIDLNTPTLSPIGIVGLQPNAISVGTEGYVDTYALRWDAEWTPDFFTALQYQHQEMDDPRIAIPLISNPFTTSKGRIDRASLTGNAVLGYGFGLSSTVAYTSSEDEGSGTATSGGSLPFLPKWAGQVALTYVSEAHVKTTLAANYIGERVSETRTKLDDYWTLDANLVWEPFDQRFELELAAYNLLDEDIELNSGMPGWGRSFKGTLRVRF